MGMYINPGNEEFRVVRNSHYVDKSGLISILNGFVCTTERFTCVSRPRRFGKSFDAKMLCAYYDCSCDFSPLFDDLAIADDPSYASYLNRYNVIYVDVTEAMKAAKDVGADVSTYIANRLVAEAREMFSGMKADGSLTGTLLNAVEVSGRRFIMIIDEWDAPIRELPADQQRDYIELLRALFKGSGSAGRIFAAAYMTGILPIKKDKGQSAVSDFYECSIIHPGPFARFAGFTEDEVRALCDGSDMDFEQMRRWYDGYQVGDITSMYNPYAVMHAIRERQYRSYWRHTSAADALQAYIDLDFEGLQDGVVRLMAGEELVVDTGDFKNDPSLIESRDDALILMVHLGYLSFEEDFDGTGLVRIPNQEVRYGFEKMLRRAAHPS